MQIVTGIDPKALQLTGILLRQYKPELAALLPNLKQHTIKDVEFNIKLSPEEITLIIQALNEIGEQWLEEKKPNQPLRDKQRQKCLSFVLHEWIRACEYYQKQIQIQLH